MVAITFIKNLHLVMKKKITSTVKRGFCVHLFLMTLLLTLSFTSSAQTTIYQENFSGFSNGYIGTNAGSDIGVWAASVSGACNNKTYWGTYDTGGLIDGMGLKTVAIGASCTLGTGSYTTTVATSNLFAYTTISTTGYTGITLEFDWKGVGEKGTAPTVYDYGRVIYRTGTTGTWQILTTGGNASYPGKYVDKNTTQHTVLNLPVGVNNLAKIQFGFRWDNDNNAGAAPGFSIDNIVVKGTGANCSGTPNAGITVLSKTADEPGATYTVSVTGYSTGAGITYQWQSNTNSAGWVNVGSSTSSYSAYTGAVAGAFGTVVQWRLLTTCTNSSLSNTSSVATFTSSYCTSVPATNSFNDGITNVTFNTINNSTSANAGNDYNNYTNISTNVTQGMSYNLSVSVNTDGNYTQYQKVWIDWNKDGDFDDVGESYELGTATNVSNGISSLCPFNITVPTDAVIGTTRMRVSSKYLEYATACFNATYDGEVEDYSINIIAGNRTLTVAGAYTGASYADGDNTIANNASVTATSGTQTGYNVTGWTGTGSVPATGATGSTTFTITEDSTISWNWTCSTSITSVTNGSGCSNITLLAASAAGTTEYRWYDATTGGTLAQTTTIGEWIISGLTQTTIYYVAAFNGTCESARVAVTATYTPTTAEITFTEGVAICEAGSVTVYAGANGTNELRWYDATTGGNLLFTGTEYTFTATESVTFYVAAAEGTCESSRTEVTVTFNGKTWNGTLGNDWNSAENWTPTGVPTSDNCVVIGTSTVPPVILSGTNASAKSLTLLSGGALVVKSGSSIDVVENVTVAIDANMTLENEGYLVQTVSTSSNTNIGAITVKRNSTPMFRSEATGWASPVEDQKLYDFAIGTVFGRIYEYDETSNVFVNSSITLQSPFVLGKGYSVRSPDNYPTFSSVTPTTPLTFEGSFTGKPNSGDIGINVTFDNFGINYVGNPYPSPISATDLFDANSIADALYFWTHEAPPINGVYAANNYAAFNKGTGGVQAAAGGLTPNGTIEVGQGFVVRTSGAGTLQFTNAMRTNQSGGQFFRQADATEDRHRMWLNLSNSENNFNQILIGYVPFATMEKDNQIDAKIIGYASSTLSSMIDNDTFVIQGRSLPFDTTDEVALGFKAKQAGSFTIDIDHVDGLFLEGQTIYIVDQLTNSIHNLSENAFTFVSEQGTFNSRFKIVYQESMLGVSNPAITNNDWIVFKNDNKINVQTNGFEIGNISIYDLTGRLLLQDDNVKSATFSCNANFAEQVLLVRVNKTLVKKVL